jgi:hypothetical protein
VRTTRASSQRGRALDERRLEGAQCLEVGVIGDAVDAARDDRSSASGDVAREHSRRERLVPTRQRLALEGGARGDRLADPVPVANGRFVDTGQLAQQLVCEATAHVTTECLAAEVGIRLNATRQLGCEHGAERVGETGEVAEHAQRVEEL